MKKIALILALSLLTSLACAQGELNFKAMSAQFKGQLTQNNTTFNFADDFGLASKSFVGEAELSIFLPKYRVKYAFTFPAKLEGNGQLTNQVTLNGVTFGPSDTKSTKPEPVNSEFFTLSHKLEVDFLTRWTIAAPALFAEYTSSSLTLKGKPVTKGSTNKSDFAEASESVSKIFWGAGLSGYQRTQNVLTLYNIGYLTAGGKGGVFADISVRYDIRRNAFVGAGYRYRQVGIGFAGGDLDRSYQGLYAEAGVAF